MLDDTIHALTAIPLTHRRTKPIKQLEPEDIGTPSRALALDLVGTNRIPQQVHLIIIRNQPQQSLLKQRRAQIAPDVPLDSPTLALRHQTVPVRPVRAGSTVRLPTPLHLAHIDASIQDDP